MIDEIKTIRRFASYNGFPRWIVNNTIKKCQTPARQEKEPAEQDDIKTLYISVPYIGRESESIMRRCKSKLSRFLKEKVKFSIQFKTKKLTFYTSNKDKIPTFSNSFVVYKYTCPGCSKQYIGKTESTLYNRTYEHGWKDKDSAVLLHFQHCDGWQHIVNILECQNEEVDKRALQINTVRENTKIIKRADHWLNLAYLESLAIKDQKPTLNTGIRSAKELSLF